MKIIDDKFKRNKLRYIIQCSVATISVFIVLLILDVISNAVVIASLGASSFIVFALPKTRSAAPKLMIGGYVVGTLSGIISHYIYRFTLETSVKIPDNLILAFLGAFAIGLTIFIMA